MANSKFPALDRVMAESFATLNGKEICYGDMCQPLFQLSIEDLPRLEYAKPVVTKEIGIDSINLQVNQILDDGDKKIFDFVCILKKNSCLESIKEEFERQKSFFDQRTNESQLIIDALGDFNPPQKNMEKILDILKKDKILCFTARYHSIVAAQNLGCWIPYITSNILPVVSNNNTKILMQERSSYSTNFPSFLHIFGGGFLPFDDQNSLYGYRKADKNVLKNAQREFEEEVKDVKGFFGLDFRRKSLKRRVFIFIEYYSDVIDDYMKPCGIIQFNFLGIDLKITGKYGLESMLELEAGGLNENIEGRFKVMDVNSLLSDQTLKIVPSAKLSLSLWHDIVNKKHSDESS